MINHLNATFSQEIKTVTMIAILCKKKVAKYLVVMEHVLDTSKTVMRFYYYILRTTIHFNKISRRRHVQFNAGFLRHTLYDLKMKK